MKKNCWILLGTLLATGAVAQVDTNALPAIPAPATVAAPAAAAPATPAPAAETTKPAQPVKTEPAKAKPAPKPKKRVIHKINEPTVNLLPGPATVTSHNLNIRGQAGLKGEVIGHLKAGETVTVLSQINLDKHALDEPAQWAEILLPSTLKVWVFSKYVDTATKTVTASRVNVRGGPGENFSVLGRLDKGQVVTEISKQGHWLQIEPPATAFAFVAAMYLEQTPAIAANSVPVTPTASRPITFVPAPAPAPGMAMNNNPPAPVPSTTEVPVGYQPGVPAAAPSATTSPTSVPPTTTSTALPPWVTKPVEPVIETAPPTNLPPRVVSHEGRVRNSVSPVAPTPYELYDPSTGMAVDYLYTSSTNLDLSRYKGAQIIVTGEEGLTARWKDTPVLTIQRIYVVDAHPTSAYDTIHSPRASEKNISGTQRMQRR